ncbi:MAG: beta-N-acetylhexosaminidase [Lysobacterales bacterium]
MHPTYRSPTRFCAFAHLVLGATVLPLLVACSSAEPPTSPPTPATATTPIQAPALIPAPAQWQARSGSLQLPPGARLHFDGGSAAEAAAQRIEHLAERLHGFTPARTDRVDDARVVVRLDQAAGLPSEAYRLDIDAQRAELVASTASGLFHGATSLALLLQTDADGALRLPQLRIDDAPRFGWRGLMLDSARHAQSVEEIKHLIDAMALHKLNVLHWHLTDDQGWRIEIKRHPRLAEVGGCRVPAGEAGQGPDGAPKPYCAYYSQEQIRELVAYAQARHIEIVPEIDMPGHAQAAVAAYPALGLMDPAPPVSSDWGVHRVLFNVEEPTLRVLEDVLEEVVELFPGAYVHIGGDEAVKDQWQQSATVQARMRELGVESETALQAWLIARMRAFLSERQRRLIGWDEILDGELPEDTIVMSWRGVDGGLAAARRGHDAVMSPSTDLYFDFLQSTSENEVPGRPSAIPLARVYAYEPIPPGLEAEHHAHILGLQANVWTEHLRLYARVQHAAFPRVAALAERGWSSAGTRDFADFLLRLRSLQPAYTAFDIEAAQTPFEVLAELGALSRSAGQGSELFELTLSSALEGTRLHYTLDGSAPRADSPSYAGPIPVQLPAQLAAQPWVGTTPVGPVTRRDLVARDARVRSSRQLAPTTGGLVLRLEDDTPNADGGEARARFDVEIFNPRWIWVQPPLAESPRLRVRAGRIPYNFQLHKEEALRRFLPARTAHGELRVENGCDGALLAEALLPADTDATGFIELELAINAAPASAAATDTVDALCLRFTGDTRPQMWVLQQAELLSAAAPDKEN